MEPSIKYALRLYHSHRYEQALTELRSLEEMYDCDPELAYFIGLCLTQLNRYEEALEYLEQVVQSDFSFLHSFQSRMVLGYIYTVIGKYRAAELEFRKIIDGGFESTQAYAALGYIYYGQKEVEESIRCLNRALELDPANANALNSLGYIYAEEEMNIENAVTLCRRSVELVPDNAVYIDSLGWVLYKAGRLSEAREHLRKALDLSPNNKDISDHLRVVLQNLSNEEP